MSLQEVHEKINRQAVLAARAQATARNFDAQLRWSDNVLTLLERCNVADLCTLGQDKPPEAAS